MTLRVILLLNDHYENLYDFPLMNYRRFSRYIGLGNGVGNELACSRKLVLVPEI